MPQKRVLSPMALLLACVVLGVAAQHDPVALPPGRALREQKKETKETKEKCDGAGCSDRCFVLGTSDHGFLLSSDTCSCCDEEHKLRLHLQQQLRLQGFREVLLEARAVTEVLRGRGHACEEPRCQL